MIPEPLYQFVSEDQGGGCVVVLFGITRFDAVTYVAVSAAFALSRLPQAPFRRGEPPGSTR